MTALRGVMAGDADAAARTGVQRNRLLIVGGLACLALLAVALRLVPTVISPSINWGDEVFQTVEPAHRLVYGYGLVTWEFQVGMRSWLLPGTIAAIIELSRLVGSGPEYYLAAIAIILGLLACAPILCAFLWCSRQFGLAPAFVAAATLVVAPELVYFGARPLNEVVAAHLLVVAWYLSEPDSPINDGRRNLAAGIVFAIVCLLRLQLAPAAALLALWPGQGAYRPRLIALVTGGLAALAFGGAFDWLTLGYPLASVWRNLYDNLYLGISSGFSVEPWYYYLLGEVGVWGAAAPLVLLLAGLGARRQPALLAAIVVLVLVHSAIGHKEYRFIYPAVLLAMLLVATGLAQLTQWVADWLRAHGLPQGMAITTAVSVLLGGWSTVSYATWSDGTITVLRQRAHDELVTMAYVHDLPGICGVGLLGKNAWVRFGGYTWLHRPVPMFWPQDASELAASAAGFDTLLYDRGPLPPALGFTAVHCTGHVCVARRPGACEPLAPPALWSPPQLSGKMPDAKQFPAIPPSTRPQ